MLKRGLQLEFLSQAHVTPEEPSWDSTEVMNYRVLLRFTPSTGHSSIEPEWGQGEAEARSLQPHSLPSLWERAGQLGLNVPGTQVWLSGPRIKPCIQGTQGGLCATPTLLQRARNSSRSTLHSLPWPETPPPAFSGASAHIRPKGRRSCRRPLFLSSGSQRD